MISKIGLLEVKNNANPVIDLIPFPPSFVVFKGKEIAVPLNTYRILPLVDTVIFFDAEGKEI